MYSGINSILLQYSLLRENTQIVPFGTGLINHTWKVVSGDSEYILQKINTQIFSKPDLIASNIEALGDYLAIHYPDYLFVPAIKTISGEGMVYDQDTDSYFRVFPFVKGSHAKTVLENANEAFEGAAQFGKFTKLLSGFDVHSLKITLPYFHDLGYRYQEFEQALQKNDVERMIEAESVIAFMKEQAGIVLEYNVITNNPGFKLRVTHHDTKISNVLFDESDKAICVIDLDTIMPGYFISDVGDMMRTCLSTVSEEEKDFTKISIREDVYKAIVGGYYSQMKNELTLEEKPYFFYAGKFMIFMQALRFLTDHLNRDTYYGAKYPGHNLIRASNQVTLLQRLLEKESLLADYQFSQEFV